MAQTVKRLPAMRETQVQFLGQEDPLKKEMATSSSILAWRMLWIEGPGVLQSMGSQNRVRLTNITHSYYEILTPIKKKRLNVNAQITWVNLKSSEQNQAQTI